ncbi:MAG: hypothetical protein FWH29_06885 [Methanobrevibacter sp.]|nr:hypothetical protein [Methanobrevibacter sp.]MCL2157678.1 hypothetical protein [Methanobrevibacter sp.]
MKDEILKNKKIIIAAIVVIALIAVGFYGYIEFIYPEIQLDEKYDTAYANMATHSAAAIDSIRKVGGIYDNPNETLSLTNSSIKDAEKAVHYSNEMVKYANSDEEKEFAKITLKINTHYLNYYKARYKDDKQWLDENSDINNDIGIYREQLLDELAVMFTEARVFLNEHPGFNIRMNDKAEIDSWVKQRIWTV